MTIIAKKTLFGVHAQVSYIFITLGKLSRYMHCMNVIDLRFKTRSPSVRRLLSPNTFWATKTHIVIYSPKPWKAASIHALYECHRFLFEKSVSQFSSVIVSKHIMGHENIYCCIFPQALESCLDTCAVLMSSIFV